MINNILPRTDLDKFFNIDPTRIKIAFYMYKAAKPLSLSQLASVSDISPQLLNHHLPKLIKEGIAVMVEEAGTKYYLLQPFYYDEGIMAVIFHAFSPIVEFINRSECDYSQTEADPEDIIANNIQALLRFFSINVNTLRDEVKKDRLGS
ncbi:hypothetical protein LCGC14_0610200 [marine sediment metagenome]|uniref:HTH arsR-type domain-containing protein n=1 Tax=marine sediment metagenome TaxID=412755 RepID=A0A0F9RS53_9ZZZZ